jgi:hypothetical protein
MPRVFLMYIPSLLILYIRNLIPIKQGCLVGVSWPYRGGAMPNFAFTEFSEVRMDRAIGSWPRGYSKNHSFE